jgi:hypothetical protein
MMSNKGTEVDSRTELEDQMARNAPLAFELQAVGDAMVELIKKAPPELQPAALAAALAVVAEFQAAADAFAQGLPGYPPSLSPESIEAKEKALEIYYKNLPPDSPAAAFLPGMRLLLNVDDMVSPVTSDAPTIPHQLMPFLINSQAEQLMKYITRKALS